MAKIITYAELKNLIRTKPHPYLLIDVRTDSEVAEE